MRRHPPADESQSSDDSFDVQREKDLVRSWIDGVYHAW